MAIKTYRGFEIRFDIEFQSADPIPGYSRPILYNDFCQLRVLADGYKSNKAKEAVEILHWWEKTYPDTYNWAEGKYSTKPASFWGYLTPRRRWR